MESHIVEARATDGEGHHLWKCNECQTLVDPWDKYCKYCGAKFVPIYEEEYKLLRYAVWWLHKDASGEIIDNVTQRIYKSWEGEKK